MGDEEDGLASARADALDVQRHLVAGQGIQRAEGLIHQEERGVVDQRPADGHPLFHAPRQLVGETFLEALEPHAGEQLHGAVAVLPRIEPPHLDLQQHIVEGGAPGQQDRVLEDDADGHEPRARAHEPRDQHGERALAASGGAHDGEELALLHVEGDAVQRPDLPLGGGEHPDHVGDLDELVPVQHGSERPHCTRNPGAERSEGRAGASLRLGRDPLARGWRRLPWPGAWRRPPRAG